MSEFEPLMHSDYGPLDAKVDLKPDFFTGFKPVNRAEIVKKEAEFYHSITAPYSVDERIEKRYEEFTSFDGEQIAIKIYRAKNATGALPALVFIHGGGFMTCSVETHDFVPAYIAANAGVTAFSVEYRLAPEHKYPLGVEDCYAAVKWVAANADRLGVDAGRISVGGDSSGGTFSIDITMLARERREFALDKQVLIYPATDLIGAVPKHAAEVYAIVGSGDDDSPSMMDIYLQPGADTKDPLVTPLLAKDFSALPAALFIQAECDALCDDGLVYAKLLQDAGVPVECHIYKGMPHAFILRTYEETFAALDVICAFLRK